VIGDAGQNFTQIGFGIETIELRRTDQTVDRRGALAASIGRQLIVPGFWLTK
jgi:hypothetical protein